MYFTNFDECKKAIEQQSVEVVDFKFVDLPGRWHHISVPADVFTRELYKSGVGVDGSSISNLRGVEAGDMCIRPDLTTGMIDPFWGRKTMSFICDIIEADTKERFDADPRFVAEKAETYLEKSGFADKAVFSPEYEFHVFDSLQYESKVNRSFYEVDSTEAAWNSGAAEVRRGRNLGLRLPPKGGYHAIPPFDSLYEVRSEMVDLIKNVARIPVKYHHHEVGGPGQMEIEVLFDPLRRSADAAMWIKYIIRNVARRHDRTATFMPKPLYNEAGNGMHVHMKLFKEGKPVFYEEGGYCDLSDTAMHFMAGLLHHGPSLSAFTNPSTNSYKRLVPGFEAPVNLFFCEGNRTAAIRIPKYATEPQERRFEYRPPDATANIYFCLAAILMAGIDGVKRKLSPKELSFGPFEGDISTAAQAEELGIKSLPASLEQALEALEQDHEYLLEGDVFSKGLINRWIDYKVTKELREIQRRPHPHEFELYYNL